MAHVGPGDGGHAGGVERAEGSELDWRGRDPDFPGVGPGGREIPRGEGDVREDGLESTVVREVVECVEVFFLICNVVVR